MKQNNKNQKKKFITKQTKADGTEEIIVQGSPSKTWWGKVCIIILVAAMLILPIVASIIVLFQ